MKSMLTFILLSCAFLFTNAQYDKPPLKTPFEKLDLYYVND